MRLLSASSYLLLTALTCTLGTAYAYKFTFSNDSSKDIAIIEGETYDKVAEIAPQQSMSVKVEDGQQYFIIDSAVLDTPQSIPSAWIEQDSHNWVLRFFPLPATKRDTAPHKLIFGNDVDKYGFDTLDKNGQAAFGTHCELHSRFIICPFNSQSEEEIKISDASPLSR